MSEKVSAGWLTNYDGNKFAPISFADQLLTNTGTKVFPSQNIGDAYTPVYIKDGIVTAGNNLSYYLQAEDGPVEIAMFRGDSERIGGVELVAGSNISISYIDESTITIASTASFSLSQATTTALGGVKIGYDTDETNQNYAVELNSDGKMYVNVPWINTRYNQADSSTLGLVKTGYKTDNANRNYGVALSSSKMYVNVPWTDCNVTHSVVSTADAYRAILVAGSEISSGGDVGGVQMHNSVYINTTSGCIYAPSLDITKGVTAASFNADSDVRLKENFRPFIHNDIFDLPLYKFDYINGEKNKIGCIAQDLQKICPEIVHENNDGYLTIEESKIVYLLLDKMKEMQKEINELKEG